MNETINQLKLDFSTGKIPNGDNFSKLIDNSYNEFKFKDSVLASSPPNKFEKGETVFVFNYLSESSEDWKSFLNYPEGSTIILVTTTRYESEGYTLQQFTNLGIGANKPDRYRFSFTENTWTQIFFYESEELKLNNHVATNASKTSKGHIQIGDGLEVSDGVVSSSFHYDNSKTLDSLSSSFLNGETLTAVTTSSTDALQMAVNSVFYDIMDYTLTSQVVFRYLIKTVKRTNGGTFQEILVFGNVAGIPYEIGRLSRLSSTTNGNPWTDWKVHMNIAVVKGNPNGVQNGLRGFLVLDILSGKQYYKSTGTSVSNTNTGWLSIGGE